MCQFNLNRLSITVFILEISFLMACQTESRNQMLIDLQTVDYQDVSSVIKLCIILYETFSNVVLFFIYLHIHCSLIIDRN